LGVPVEPPIVRDGEAARVRSDARRRRIRHCGSA
jgi:hypothetical protein